MQVEIWSDIACPWCYIGKRRFERALEQFGGDVEVSWRAFELDPSAPADAGIGLNELLARKYGMAPEQAQAANDRVTELAEAEGLGFQLARARPGNTFNAHRLVKLAEVSGLGEAATERLFQAYFGEGRCLGNDDELLELAQEIGLDGAAAREVLDSDAFAEEVRGDEQAARDHGIQGVPFFALDGRVGVSGAQPVEHLVEALEAAAAGKE